MVLVFALTADTERGHYTPRTASSATLALNSGVYVVRFFVMPALFETDPGLT